MPTTIQAGFEQLRRNLEITGLQSQTVSTRQTNVRAAVQKELTIATSFLTGSYQRNTLIAPLSEADVDIFTVLDPSYYQQNGQAALLDKVKRVIAKTYGDSNISRNGQAVTVKFSDFTVDVVPAFHRSGNGYLIPDSIFQRWIATDPTQHVELWTAANKKQNNLLVPLLKMLKGWNRKHSQLLRSFHLEAMAVSVFSNAVISDFPSATRLFFDKSRALITTGVFDPAGYGGNLGDYLNTWDKRKQVLDRLDAALKYARAAEISAASMMIPQAFKQWDLVFGNYFPAYG